MIRSRPHPMKPVKHPYASVHVLLLSWQNDDLQVKKEVEMLGKVFKTDYGYQTESFLIPDDNPDGNVQKVLESMVEQSEDVSSLLIVYYAGHGFLHDQNMSIWTSSEKSGAPQVRWYRHQSILEDSKSDVLLLLDCCEPLGSGGKVRRGTRKEILAATGFDGKAPPPGPYSFTFQLWDILKGSKKEPITTSALHYRMIRRLSGIAPGHRGEHGVTPVWKIMGEGGTPSSPIELVSYQAYPLNVIAVMGATGCGKSSLVNKICGEDVATVGHDVESETKDVLHYSSVIGGKTVTMIDTPGFDDTVLTDRMVLERIATHLYEQYEMKIYLSGLLYVRDITSARTTGTHVKNRDMFMSLCGPESMKNVILVTTKWDKIPIEEAERREAQLKERFWSGMLKLTKSLPQRVGLQVDAAAGTVSPRDAIVQPMLKYEKTVLQLQRELQQSRDHGRFNLDVTTAGRQVGQSLDFKLEAAEREYKNTLSSIHQTHEREAKHILKAQAEEIKDEIEECKDENEMLKDDFDEVMQAERKRRDELFGYQVLADLGDYIDELEQENSMFRHIGVSAFAYTLYKACKTKWKKDGVSQALIKSAKENLRVLGRSKG